MTIAAYDPKLIHPLFPRFCPCQDCPYYLDTDNYITFDGTYPVKNDIRRRRPTILSLGSSIVFPKPHPSDLFGHHGSLKEYVQTAKMSSYGALYRTNCALFWREMGEPF